MRTRLAIALIAGLALAGTACGSGDPTTATATTTTAAADSATTTTDPPTTAVSTTAVDTPTTAVAPTTIPTTIATTSKEDFLAAGNAICARMNAESAAITAALPGGKPTTTADYVTLFTKNADLIASTLDELKALPQPPGDEATLAAMYADVDALVDLSRRAATVFSSGDTEAMRTIGAEGDAVQSKANASANAYGLTECGKGG